MQIAVLLYDQFTALDAVGPYEVISRLPGAQTVFVGERVGPVRNDVGSLALAAEATLAEVPHPDIVVVPGGPGQNAHMADGAVHRWLRTADTTSTWTTSVCTGSLILAAAGLLTGRRATSHWLAIDQLEPLGALVAADRVVFDGKYATAAGVSAGIDLALALTGRIAGDAAAQVIQLGIEYDPQPSYRAGSPDKAPGEILAAVRAASDFILYGHGGRAAWPEAAARP
jgi:putative intracellular protease/amidase